MVGTRRRHLSLRLLRSAREPRSRGSRCTTSIRASWRLESLTYAGEVVPGRGAGTAGSAPALERAERLDARVRGQKRRRSTATTVTYTPFAERGLSLEPPAYFRSMEPDAEQMTYGQLKSYVAALQASGAYVVPVSGGAAAEDRVSLRDRRDDAAGRALRGHDRPPRRAVRHRHRDRAGDRLLDHVERLRRARLAAASSRRCSPRGRRTSSSAPPRCTCC